MEFARDYGSPDYTVSYLRKTEGYGIFAMPIRLVVNRHSFYNFSHVLFCSALPFTVASMLNMNMITNMA